MTAFSGPDRDQLRQQLAEVLDPFTGPADALLDALLPVVEAHTAQLVADALLWAAWTVEHTPGIKHQATAVTALRAQALRTHEGDAP